MQYNDIMTVMASQITTLTIVYSTDHSRCRLKKTSKLCVTALCEGNSSVTGEFPTQRARNSEYVSIWWRHHGIYLWVLLNQCIIGLDNGLLPNKWQVIICTNDATSLIPILIEMHTFSFKKMHLKMSSAKQQLFSLGLNVLTTTNHIIRSCSWFWQNYRWKISRFCLFFSES